MENIMLNELYTKLKYFMITENWYSNENIPRQARAMFVTICIVGDFEADTSVTDNMLLDLYCSTGIEDLMEFEDFENFMYEHIV